MPYYKRKIRRSRINKREAKLYLSMIIVCALAAMVVVLVIELVTEKVPTLVQQVEDDMIKMTVESATGKKIDAATVARLKKAYEKSEGDVVRRAARWISGKKLDPTAVARLKKQYEHKDRAEKKR